MSDQTIIPRITQRKRRNFQKRVKFIGASSVVLAIGTIGFNQIDQSNSDQSAADQQKAFLKLNKNKDDAKKDQNQDSNKEKEEAESQSQADQTVQTVNGNDSSDVVSQAANKKGNLNLDQSTIDSINKISQGSGGNSSSNNDYLNTPAGQTPGNNDALNQNAGGSGNSNPATGNGWGFGG